MIKTDAWFRASSSINGRETNEGGACCTCANADDPATEPVAIFVAPADGCVPAVISIALVDGSTSELAMTFVELADAIPLKPAEVFVAFVSGSDPELGAVPAVIFIALVDGSSSGFAITFVELADAIPLKPAEVFVVFVSGSDPELGAISVAVTTELFAGAPFTVGGSDGLRACNVCESALRSERAPCHCHSDIAKIADTATAIKIINTDAIRFITVSGSVHRSDDSSSLGSTHEACLDVVM